MNVDELSSYRDERVGFPFPSCRRSRLENSGSRFWIAPCAARSHSLAYFYCLCSENRLRHLHLTTDRVIGTWFAFVFRSESSSVDDAHRSETRRSQPTRYCPMSPQPHDGPAEEGLSSSTLRSDDDPEQIERPPANAEQLQSSMPQLAQRHQDEPLPLQARSRWTDARCWIELERTYQELERLFDRLQVIYRPLSLTLVRSPLGRLVNERLPSWRSWFNLRGRTLDVDPPGGRSSRRF